MSAENKILSLRKTAKYMELMILVWGPGDPGPGGSPALRRYWEKRKQIREVLQQVFPNAEVFFSEDAELEALTRSIGRDILDQELVQAYSADCILVLDLTRGAHVEVDRFSNYPAIAAKMNVLIPDRYVGSTGLVAHVHKRTNVIGFSDEEFEMCRVATEKAVQIVEMVAINKLISGP
jgi:hypothetical protein